jgi:hypothetical protein
MMVEVRCCCEPGKRLGWVLVEPHRVVEGGVLQSPYMAPIALTPSGALPSKSTTNVIEARVRRFIMVTARLSHDAWALEQHERKSWLALDSGDQPLEVWKLVRAFRPDTVTEMRRGKA